METDNKPKRQIIISNVLPDNDRVRKKIKVEKQKEAERQKLEDEKKRRMLEVYNMEEMLKKQQQEDDKLKKLQEQEQFEQNTKLRYQIIQKMEGNLVEIIRSLINNTSTYELSFAGLDLDTWNFTNLMLFLPENKSLLTLNLSRKNLTDAHAIQIAEMLKVNKKLRRLELEGNFFGPESAKYFAEALKVNKTLRYLDLENNKLTDNGNDDTGLLSLFEALKHNTMLISINLTNNYLTLSCGQAIIDCLRKNKSIIHLEVFANQRFALNLNEREENDSKYISLGLGINQVKEIKDKLHENREAYNALRKEEWKERKQMTFEGDEVRNVNTYIEKKQ